MEKLQGSLAPLVVLVNKIDQSDEETVMQRWPTGRKS